MNWRHLRYLVGIAFLAAFAFGWFVGLHARPSQAKAAAEAQPAPRPAPSPASTKPMLVQAADPHFKDKITPFLATYCNGCHNATKAAGGLTLDAFQSEAHARRDRRTWESVQQAILTGEMPPRKKPQPSETEKAMFLAWTERLLAVDCGSPKDPGRVTLRRLNRAEYNNTIRDLCGVDFHPADDFPTDDVGYGFDNIGDVLSLQPILLEKYLAAADKILDQALVGAKLTPSKVQPFRTQPIQTTPRTAKVGIQGGGGKITFTTEGVAYLPKFNFPNDADYIIKLQAWGTKVGDSFPKVKLQIAEKDLQTFTIDAPESKPGTFEWRGKLPAAEVRVGYAFTNPYSDKASKSFRSFGVLKFEIEGPLNPQVSATAPVRKILTAFPKTEGEKVAAARKVLAEFAPKAFRRPVTPEEVARLVKLFEISSQQGDAYEDAIRLPLKAILASPHFLFRVEDDPKDPKAVRLIDEHELASRLSYFLWSTMPDAELFGLADRGQLRKPGVLEAQVRRMLKDPKSHALTENFAGQWLQLRSLRTLTPDKGYFPNWSEPIRVALIREAELFFENIVREDRSILEFLDADYSFLNEALGRYYGIANVSGSDFRKVKLPDHNRGGVITMGSTLTVTSNPTRTSPVKRGKWILENVLGTPPPPPAPDAPPFPPTDQIKGTVRQQLEQHRANPACATCHAKLDPLGLGLENFDAVGRWRTSENKLPVDASGVLPDGASFDGPATMKKVLLAKADLFRRCLAEKMLTYALGRGLEYYDKCVLDEVTTKLTKGQDRFSSLILAIVQSEPFQKRKGQRTE